MIEGFKKFIAQGNMIDMAVGVVMGAAVTDVVNAIVKGVINPFIAMIFGKPNMDHLMSFTFNNSTVSFGMVLGAVINFLLIAIAVYFCIIVPINKLHETTTRAMMKARGIDPDTVEQEDEMSAEDQTVVLLQDIRDALTANGAVTGEHIRNTQSNK